MLRSTRAPLRQTPVTKQSKKRQFRWRRLAAIAGIALMLILGAAWYAYDRMTDKLLEVLMDETLQGTTAAGITDDEAEGTAFQGAVSGVTFAQAKGASCFQDTMNKLTDLKNSKG